MVRRPGLRHFLSLAVRVTAAVALAVVLPVLVAPDEARTVGNTSFDLGSGASTYVSISDTPALRLSNNFTIEAWVYLRDGSNETIIDKGPVYSYLFQIYPNGQGGLGLYAGYGGNYQWVYSSNVTLPQNQWNHVAVSFTNAANGLKFYANGNLVSQHTPAGALVSSNGDVNLGRQEPGGCNCNLLQGRLDEVRIWSAARTQAQIQSTMAIEPAANTAGLLAYWDFNDGSGSTVTNRTNGAGMNGTIVNFPGNSPWVSGVPRVSSGASDTGLGSALNNFVWGPSVQNSANVWQYHEVPDDLSSSTLLPDWQKTGNEIIGNQNQWDNNRVNGAYPFVQYVHSPTTSAFGGSASLMIHPDDGTKRASVAWKNTTAGTLTVDVDATLKFAYPGNNSNGATYALHRGLSGTARYSLATSGTIPTASSNTFTVDESVQLQAGELVYLSVGNNGQYFWDHTIVDMSVTVAVPTVSTVPTITGTTAPGQVLTAANGTWTGSPSSYTYQWKRSTTAGGAYVDIAGANTSSYTLQNGDVGYFIKVAVTATNTGGNSSAALSAATSVVATPVTTTTAPVVTTTSPATTMSPSTTAVLSSETSQPTSGAVGTPGTAGAVSPGATPSSVASVPVTRSGPVATTTTSTSTTSTTVVESVAPDAGEVATGDAEVKVGDSTEPVTISRVDNRLVVTAGGLTARVAAVGDDGNAAPLDADGNVQLRAGGNVQIDLEGFAPGAGMEAWMFSEPVRIGTAVISSSGSFSGGFDVPRDVSAGAHRITVVTEGADGDSVTLTVGVLVGEWGSEQGIALWLIATPILLAVGGALVIPATRRRRRRPAV